MLNVRVKSCYGTIKLHPHFCFQSHFSPLCTCITLVIVGLKWSRLGFMALGGTVRSFFHDLIVYKGHCTHWKTVKKIMAFLAEEKISK